MLKYSSWQLPECAPILSLEQAQGWYEDGWRGNLILTSGFAAPIHPGHISLISDAKSKVYHLNDSKHWPYLVYIVNDDIRLKKKTGHVFMPLKVRAQIVSAIKEVNVVVPLELSSDDDTVNTALEAIRPAYFAKGGDRCDEHSIPEWATCERLGIKILTGCGDTKVWSSSNFLRDHAEHVIKSMQLT